MRRAPLFTALLAASGCESTTNLLKIPAEVAWVAASTVDPDSGQTSFSPLIGYGTSDLSLYTPGGRQFSIIGYSDAQVLPLARFSAGGVPSDEPLSFPQGCEPVLPAPIYSVGVGVGVDPTGQFLGPGPSDFLAAPWISGTPEGVSRLVVDAWCERAEPFQCELEADLSSLRIRGVERRCGLGELRASYLPNGVLCANFEHSPWKCGPPVSFVGGADLTCVRPRTSEACRVRILADSGDRDLVVDRYYYSSAAPLPLGAPVTVQSYQLGSAYDLAPLDDRVVVSLPASPRTSTATRPCDERPGTLVLVRPGSGTSSVSAPACLERLAPSGPDGFVGVYSDHGWYLGRFDADGSLLERAPVNIASGDPLALEAHGAHPVELLYRGANAWVLWSRQDGSSVVTGHGASLELLSVRAAPDEGGLFQLIDQATDELGIINDRGLTAFQPTGAEPQRVALSPGGAGAKVLGALGLGSRRVVVARQNPTGLYLLDPSPSPLGPVWPPAACFDVPDITLTQVAPYPNDPALQLLAVGLTQDHIAVATFNLTEGRFLPQSIVTESTGIISRIKVGDRGNSIWLLNPLEHSLLRVHRKS